MKISRLKKGDEAKVQELSKLFKKVFEMESSEPPSISHCAKILNSESNFFVVAEINDTVVGGLSAYVLPSIHGHSECYVFDLAVAEELQRQGTGTLLMNFLFDLCKEQGIEGVFVNAENEDVHAIKFYQKIGGETNEEVTLFWFPLDES